MGRCTRQLSEFVRPRTVAYSVWPAEFLEAMSPQYSVSRTSVLALWACMWNLDFGAEGQRLLDSPLLLLAMNQYLLTNDLRLVVDHLSWESGSQHLNTGCVLEPADHVW